MAARCPACTPRGSSARRQRMQQPSCVQRCRTARRQTPSLVPNSPPCRRRHLRRRLSRLRQPCQPQRSDRVRASAASRRRPQQQRLHRSRGWRAPPLQRASRWLSSRGAIGSTVGPMRGRTLGVMPGSAATGSRQAGRVGLPGARERSPAARLCGCSCLLFRSSYVSSACGMPHAAEAPARACVHCLQDASRP